MGILLVNLAFCFLFSSPLPTTVMEAPEQSNLVVLADEEEPKKEENNEGSGLTGAILGSGVGLVAIGGVGAGVVAYNNSKPKNVPVNEKEKKLGFNKKKKPEEEN